MERKFNIHALNEKHSELVPPAYISVFIDHPWHEEFECSCGAGPYSRGCKRTDKTDRKCEEFDSGKLFLIEENGKCNQCGSDLSTSLKPIYTTDSVKSDFLSTLEKQGFIGSCAISERDLVAFCWGYNFPLDPPKKTGSTWYLEAGEILKSKGINPQSSFYHNESGTLLDFCGNGLGSIVLRDMLLRSQANNKEDAVFRTINPAMVRCYEKVFGIEKGHLKPKFSDPNPEKRQQWYVLQLNKLDKGGI